MRTREHESNDRDRVFGRVSKDYLRGFFDAARFWRRTRSLYPVLDVGRTCSTLPHAHVFHTLTMMKSPLSHCSKSIASHSRSSAFNRPILTSPPLYLSDGGWSVFTYRRSVWRLSRSTSSWFNEKVDCVMRRRTKN